MSLHKAARNGCIDTVNDLLKAGANPNALDQERFPPLYWALIYGHTDVMNILLENKADPEALGGGMSALQLVSTLDGFGFDVHAVVDVLLEHKANPNVSDESGTTPLHEAAARGDTETAFRLLVAGAFPNACDNKGRTALHRAASKGHDEIVQLLLDAEANP
jgi:ankyrin repeat protein